MRYEFTAEVWRWTGDAAWHFVTLPAELTHGLKQMRGPARAWGSMRVKAQTGQTTWRTSLFPDSRSGAFLLPLKAEVRRRETLVPGDVRRFVVELEL
jgi:hypothetical protein